MVDSFDSAYPYVSLESAKYGIIPLNGVFTTNFGMEALAGSTGFGLPPVSVQWREGAGEGSTFRGKRVLSRDFDIPIFVSAPDRQRLKDELRQLALVLSGEVALRFHESPVESWFVRAHRTGGGEHVMGEDTDGETELLTVLTFRAGDPYWSRSETSSVTVKATSGKGLLGAGSSLTSMSVSASQAFGTVRLDNPGDADAFPVWTVDGPGNDFRASIGTYETGDYAAFHWTGTLSASERLTIDTRSGKVLDQDSNNRYSEFAAAPRL